MKRGLPIGLSLGGHPSASLLLWLLKRAAGGNGPCMYKYRAISPSISTESHLLQPPALLAIFLRTYLALHPCRPCSWSPAKLPAPGATMCDLEEGVADPVGGLRSIMEVEQVCTRVYARMTTSGSTCKARPIARRDDSSDPKIVILY
jgi:hypothetical protein